MSFNTFDFAAELKSIQQKALYRQRTQLQSSQGAVVKIEGRTYLNFCSNDYLGLAADERIKAAQIDAIKQYGVGSGASHLVCGHSQAHHQLEEALADWVGRSRALLFTSGYAANLGTIQALLGRHDVVFEDRLNHASLIDGALLSRATLHRYAHADTQHLEQQFQAIEKPSVKALVVSDSVFSMDGDIAPLSRLSHLSSQYGAMLMVDEAHGLGLLGKEGAGSVIDQGLDQTQVPVIMGTLGKSMGCSGAFIAGSDELIEYLIQRARTYIYTTALPPALCSAALEAVKVVRAGDDLRDKLNDNIRYFRGCAEQMGVMSGEGPQLMDSTTAIQPLLVGDSQLALTLSQQLRQQAILVSAIRPPTVPAGTARLRVTLSAAHSHSMIDQLITTLSVLRVRSETTEGKTVVAVEV